MGEMRIGMLLEELSWQGNQFDIELRHVSFGYRHDKPVLKDINIRISPGEKWLVLGESGSGKSTLLKLIAKMYESYEGEISIGGHNYKGLTERPCKECYARQSTMLFI